MNMKVWNDSIGVVLRAVVVTVYVHVVLLRAAVCQWCWHKQDDSWRPSLLAEGLQTWLLGHYMYVGQFVSSLPLWFV